MIAVLLYCISCNNETPTPIVPPEGGINTDKYQPNSWDTIICNQLSINEIFIGSKYLGIQNWDCVGNPPDIYPAAVFPKETFATAFDKEISGRKNPIVVYTNFSDPFISTIENPSGSSYRQYLKKMLKSEEYKSNSSPKLNLYRLANLNTLDSLVKMFPDNPSLAETLMSIVKQKMNLSEVKSWTMGEIVFKGVTITMDIPADGIFVDKLIDEEDLVYLRSITYGSTAYFVIGSDLPYLNVKSILSTPSIVDNEKRDLENSSMVFLTNSSIAQDAEIYTTFKSIGDYFMQPYSEGSYGYPIYCTGCSLVDNSYVH